jgi:hypothetical protein
MLSLNNYCIVYTANGFEYQNGFDKIEVKN